MLQLSITVESALVRQGLENLGKEIPDIGRRRIYTMVNRITRQMEEYPPQRMFQRYVRTGKLGFSWKVKKLDDGYMVYNTAANSKGRSYAHYVVGSAYGTNQAWMHKGRWPLYRDVVDAEVEKLPAEVGKEIVMVARRNNLEASQ